MPEKAQKGISLGLQPRSRGYTKEDVRHASRDAMTPGEVPCVRQAQAFPVHARWTEVCGSLGSRSVGSVPRPPEVAGESDGGYECERPCGRSFSAFSVR